MRKVSPFSVRVEYGGVAWTPATDCTVSDCHSPAVNCVCCCVNSMQSVKAWQGLFWFLLRAVPGVRLHCRFRHRGAEHLHLVSSG